MSKMRPDRNRTAVAVNSHCSVLEESSRQNQNTMKITIIFLPVGVTAAAFISPQLKGTRTTFVSEALFAGQERKIGHLEPIPVPRSEPVPETPGIPQGADLWPSPVQDPNVFSDRMPPETPGVNRVEWPSPVQEPKINAGPPETPGLNNVDWPAATQEPNV